MGLHLTDGQVATVTGTLVGGGIAVFSQIVFYILAERRRQKDHKYAIAKQRLDEFYSPLLTRLLEIEYKLWLDHEVKEQQAKHENKALKQDWDEQLAKEIDMLDREIVDIFRRKRWLALDSTVIECQKLIRYLESSKLQNKEFLPDVISEWADVRVLKDLHKDVRQHHIKLMDALGIDKCGTGSLLPPDGSRLEGESSFHKYQTSLEKRVSETGSENSSKPDSAQ